MECAIGLTVGDTLQMQLLLLLLLTPVSRSQIALAGMLHLTCGTTFVLLFVFLISKIPHHHCSFI